jgi:preprotein translocase subunit SecE
MIEKLKAFLQDVRVESSKVTWPTRKELQESTMVVIASVFVISIVIGIMDRIIALVMGLVI